MLACRSCFSTAALERRLDVDSRERRQISVAAFPAILWLFHESDVLEAQAFQEIPLEAVDIPRTHGAGNRNILERNVFEYRAVALQRLEIDVAGSIWDQGVVAELDAHEVSSAPIRVSVCLSSNLPDLERAVSVVYW